MNVILPARHPQRHSDSNWRGTKIKRIAIDGKGAMTGKVGMYSDATIRNGSVSIRGTIWGATTDSLGGFLIKDVLPGKYTASAQAFGYHRKTIYEIRIAMDSVSVVGFPLSPEMIPESPMPKKWRREINTWKENIHKMHRVE